MGGWLSLIYGFAGLTYDRGLHLANHLPQKIESLTFTITYQQEAIRVKLQGGEIECQLQPNSKLKVVEDRNGLWIK